MDEYKESMFFKKNEYKESAFLKNFENYLSDYNFLMEIKKFELSHPSNNENKKKLSFKPINFNKQLKNTIYNLWIYENRIICGHISIKKPISKYKQYILKKIFNLELKLENISLKNGDIRKETQSFCEKIFLHDKLHRIGEEKRIAFK